MEMSRSRRRSAGRVRLAEVRPCERIVLCRPATVRDAAGRVLLAGERSDAPATPPGSPVAWTGDHSGRRLRATSAPVGELLLERRAGLHAALKSSICLVALMGVSRR